MSSVNTHRTVKAELDRLARAFFEAVSFEESGKPNYQRIHELFVEQGLLIKNSGQIPEISTLIAFIEPRQASVDAGDLTRFHEAELSETTQVFGSVAQRFSAYTKSGTLRGTPFNAKGMISTQFIQTPHGWRMSSMAWDDERPGLSVRDDDTPSLPNRAGCAG
jgi:hypothetical protein